MHSNLKRDDTLTVGGRKIHVSLPLYLGFGPTRAHPVSVTPGRAGGWCRSSHILCGKECVCTSSREQVSYFFRPFFFPVVFPFRSLSLFFPFMSPSLSSPFVYTALSFSASQHKLPRLSGGIVNAFQNRGFENNLTIYIVNYLIRNKIMKMPLKCTPLCFIAFIFFPFVYQLVHPHCDTDRS